MTAFDLTPAKRKILDEPESTRMLSNHFKELNSTAILLIRNPFKAIIGHRHLDEGGHTGHASPKSFMGRGKYFVTTDRPYSESRILILLTKFVKSNKDKHTVFSLSHYQDGIILYQSKSSTGNTFIQTGLNPKKPKS